MFPVIHLPIKSNGAKYSLHHLQPTRVYLADHGHDGSTIAIRISYHSHVYSIADQDDGTSRQFSDEGGKRRYFCPKRHQHSLNLPQICKAMIEQNYPTWISQDRNTRNNMAVADSNPKDGLLYVILYSLKPSHESQIDVEVIVKSAYEKYINDIGKLKKSGVRQIVKKCYYDKISIPK
jgi:hypothetical protein